MSEPAEAWPEDRAAVPIQVAYDLGFDGEFKRGVWTPVRATITNHRDGDFLGEFVVESEDVDGVPVTFAAPSQSFTLAAGETKTYVQYAKVGRLPWRVLAGIKEQGAEQYLDQKYFDQVSGGNRKATSFFVLQLGPSLPISRSRLQSSLAVDAELVEVSVLQEDQLASLPDKWIGYESVDLMILPTRSSGLLQQLSKAQAQAIRDWVFQGGRLILFAGKQAQALSSAGHPFADLIPGKPTALITDWNTSGLENYGNAQQRIFLDGEVDSLAALDVSDGRVLLRDQENAQALYPLIVRSVRGFGMVVYVAFDIDTPAFEDWDSASRVLEKLIAVGRNAGSEDAALSVQRVNHAGYQDISGQLRAALEKFDAVTPVRFVWIAVLLVFLVLLIGPLDYYVLKKLKRPDLTWATFPLAVALVGVIVFAMTRALPSETTWANQIRIVDVDVESGVVRGTDYLAVYSPQVQAVDIQPAQPPRADGQLQIERQFTIAGWHGLPGTGLGALGRNSFQTYVNHEYQIDTQTAQLSSVPVQHGGTKSLRSRWSGQATLDRSSELHADPISGLLRGTLTNPLDIELFDVEILYDGRVYPIGQSFKPGQSIDLFDISGVSQGIDNYYARYQTGSSKGERRSWKVMAEPVPRIVKQMMFNQGIGGAKYTGLLNRYESFLDISHALAYNRAVLVGRASQGSSEFSVASDQTVQPGLAFNFYRVVFTVSTEK